MPLKSHEQDSCQHPSVVVLGEVLIDVFPDGSEVLGGAPFNVAWNLRGFGLNPLIVSSIGNDLAGENVLASMTRWGLETAGLYKSPHGPTGRVKISMNQGEPEYLIPPNQSFDKLTFDLAGFDLIESISDAGLLYHGSLFLRSETNRTFFSRLNTEVCLPRFVDLNIREPWFDKSWLQILLRDATWVKLNIHELNLLTDSRSDPANVQSIRNAVKSLRRQEALTGPQNFLVTCGDQGAYWIGNEQSIFSSAATVDSFVDSVGAGDAFASAVIHGIVRGKTPEVVLDSAVKFAAAACQIQGAVSSDLEHYLPYAT